MKNLKKNMKEQGNVLNNIKNEQKLIREEINTKNKLLIKLIDTVKKNNNNESNEKKNIEIIAQSEKKVKNNRYNKNNIIIKNIPVNNRYRKLFNANVQESSSFKYDS